MGSDKPEKLERAAITLLTVCEETVPLKYVPCVNCIFKILKLNHVNFIGFDLQPRTFLSCGFWVEVYSNAEKYLVGCLCGEQLFQISNAEKFLSGCRAQLYRMLKTIVWVEPIFEFLYSPIMWKKIVLKSCSWWWKKKEKKVRCF